MRRVYVLWVAESGQQVIDRAYEALEHELPERVARGLRWLRDPKQRWLRLTAGLLLIVASFLWFLPVLGLELLPLGLLIIAQDVPFLRRPVGRMILWFVDRWNAFKRWRASRRRTGTAG
jgi:hypothetical protein